MSCSISVHISPGANDELVSFAAIIWVFMKKRCMTTQITAVKETNDEHVGHNSRQLAEGQEQNHPVFSVTITLFYFLKNFILILSQVLSLNVLVMYNFFFVGCSD